MHHPIQPVVGNGISEPSTVISAQNCTRTSLGWSWNVFVEIFHSTQSRNVNFQPLLAALPNSFGFLAILSIFQIPIFYWGIWKKKVPLKTNFVFIETRWFNPGYSSEDLLRRFKDPEVAKPKRLPEDVTLFLWSGISMVQVVNLFQNLCINRDSLDFNIAKIIEVNLHQ